VSDEKEQRVWFCGKGVREEIIKRGKTPKKYKGSDGTKVFL
jgi:hypothetical protein